MDAGMTTIAAPGGGGAAAVSAGRSPVPGQFDDAEDDQREERAAGALPRPRLAPPGLGPPVAAGFPPSVRRPESASEAGVEGEMQEDESDLAWDDEEEDDGLDDDGYYDDDELFLGGAGGALGGGANGNSGGGSSHPALSSAVSSKRLNLSLSHSVANSVQRMQGLESHKRTLTQGRDDRATSEQVLDPRTRLILFKLLSKGFLELIDGCLSTGKEANVYYAKAGAASARIVAPEHRHVAEYAIKVYKTSILVFKDRDRYVSGESRWRNGYSRSNPRKMVQLWAEKELRNYRRIYQAGIPTPAPVLLKSHVLVMEFLGKDGWPSPRLKDAALSEKRLREAYVQCALVLRHLFQRCKLVHGDLSEYNLLWHDDRVYVIDCSQSVLSDHPSALDFLRKDIANVNDFFRKAARLSVMTTRQLFEFVTSDAIGQDEASELDRLDEIMALVQADADGLALETEEARRDARHREEVDEAVFLSSFLPRSLSQVAEHEVRRIERGEAEPSYAKAVAALTGGAALQARGESRREEPSAPIDAETVEGQLGTRGDDSGNIGVSDSDDDDSAESPGALSESDDDDEGDARYVKAPRTPEEVQREKLDRREERKQNKMAVKEAQSEKRKTKVKKKDKKRAIKKSKSGNRKVN
jgi:RIO kinase 1